MQRVLNVKSVHIGPAEIPSSTLITAIGEVPTSGCKNAQLGPWLNTETPTSQIQDFDFYADEPSWIVGQVISPIHADFQLNKPLKDYWGKGIALKGVRVHSRTNTVESTSLIAIKTKNLGSSLQDWRPWPWTLGIPEATGKRTPLDLQLKELLNKSLRVYRTGDPITQDYNERRANIELSREGELIVEVWIG